MKIIPKNTSKLVRFLLRNIEETGFNINQIAKSVDISVGSSFKILKELEQDSIVNVRTVGNGRYYRLNLENDEASKLCELLLLEEKRQLVGYPKIYGESLQKFKNAESIVLFGSILTKKVFNDVDVLFISNRPKEAINFCLELSKLRTKPIVPLILKKEDFIGELKNKKEAIISLIREGIILKGEVVFIDMIKHAKK